MARTSQTDPLRIDAVPVGPSPAKARIGITICPGKQGDSAYGPPWQRDLEEDLDAIAAWGAHSLVTLLEPAEVAALGVSDLPAQARRGLRWHHAPIPDVDVPGPAFETAWSEVSHTLHRTLDQDGSIVIHCRGGLGRAGLVAALLLIERGVAAETATARVREARPGAIETPAQEDWLRARATDLRNKPALRYAALVGGACGDSLGGEIEFLPLASIRAQNPTGLADLACFDEREGEITDDTQMTLFTMEGLLRARAAGTDPVEEVHRALLRWLRTQGETPQIAGTGDEGLIQDGRFWHRRAPGMTCLSALCAAQRLGAPAVNDSKGCGTIMRVAPIALLCPREDVHDLAMTTSALTHGHPTGQIAAAAWAGMLADVGTGMELEEAAEAALGRLTGDAAGETRGAIRAALDAPRDGEPATVETLGGGWTAEEALSIALYACLANDDIEFGLRCAATHSGDSDSTAAVAGNMMGLLHPEGLLRHRWANRVQFREWFAKMNADWMIAAASGAWSGSTRIS